MLDSPLNFNLITKFFSSLYSSISPLIIYSLTFTLLACGVKGPPSAPVGTNIIPWEVELTKDPDVIEKQNQLENHLKLAFEERNLFIQHTQKVKDQWKVLDKISSGQKGDGSKKKNQLPGRPSSEEKHEEKQKLIALCEESFYRRSLAVKAKRQLKLSFHSYRQAVEKRNLVGGDFIEAGDIEQFNQDARFLEAVQTVRDCQDLVKKEIPPEIESAEIKSEVEKDL